MWSEAETKLLIQVEEELQGTKNINIAIDEILKSKTAKQITNKRNTLFIRAKTTKEYTSPPPVPLAIPLVEMLKDAICVSGGENVDTSAELLTRAIEGKSVDDLQDSVRHNKNTLLKTQLN